ncbi:MAG: ATP-binding protein [Prevotellaceae bacterium]|jgi:hypothetical protein|nr:ATP-binding protein [Prevotellaceae bacterium]
MEISNHNILLAMRDALPVEPFNTGTPPAPGQMYLPTAHKKSLQLYSSLVVGARGVGKSTWTSALADDHLRQEVLGIEIPDLSLTDVFVGFSGKAEPDKYPDPTTGIIRDLLKEYAVSEFWQAIVARNLFDNTDEIPVDKWGNTVAWIRSNQEEWSKRLYETNMRLKEKGRYKLLVFDALDRTSDDWESMDNLLRALLSLSVRLKGYSNIYTKIFLREDQFSRNITNFPDSSKLLSTQTALEWSPQDLHGLLWQHLCNADGENGTLFREIYREVVKESLTQNPNNGVWMLSKEIKNDEQLQRELFKRLAGPWMGTDPRRGVPYVWVVSHLADGKKQTSPRSFLAAIKEAAESSIENRNSKYPLYYGSIKTSVRRASSIRVNEIAEDYPWVGLLCNLLKDNNVPISFEEVKNIWSAKYPEGPQTIEAEFSKRISPQTLSNGWRGIKDELARIGIFEEISDERINMPDLYRIGFGLGRKGGVKPIKK